MKACMGASVPKSVPDVAASEDDRIRDVALTALLDDGDTITQFVCAVILSLRSVTAAFNAYSPPETLTPAFTVIEVKARILPAKTVAVPSVAEDSTCQKMLHAFAPLMRITDEAVAVVSVDLTWKIKTASGLFCPSRISVPVIPTDEDAV